MQLEGRQFAQYRLVRLLRRGGMGEIYLGEDIKLNRQVAMKVIRTDIFAYDDDEEAREATRLFLREAQLVAKLDHPHILPLYDADEVQIGGTSLLYMVMPLRQEHSFADWLEQYAANRALSPRAVERIVRQAASALQYAHERGIIHQDIKASNFLIRDASQSPAQLYLQLADFGVAKLMTTTTTQSQIVRGTPTHMAPEQWENRAVPATDQYALAVMAYELLTAQPPFEMGNHQRLWYQHAYIQPPPPSTLNPDLPLELDGVLLRALAKSPYERYRSISAFALSLRQALLNASNEQQHLANSGGESRTSTERSPSPTVLATELAIEETIQPRASKGSRTKAFLLIGLALILIAASAGVFTFPLWYPSGSTLSPIPTSHSGNRQPAGTTPNVTPSLQANATSSAQASTTSQAQVGAITATAQANATGTAIAEHNATATAQSIASAQATATIGAYNNMPGKLSFTDPLQDNSKGLNWDINYISGVGGCQFTGGAYQSSVPQVGPYSACYAEASSYSNFFYEIQVNILQGDQGGLLFRRDSVSGSFYYFHNDTKGKFALDLYQNDILVKTLTEGSSNYIDITPGHDNLLAVQANGSAINLFINKHLVGSAIDNTLSHGQIGVIASAVTGPTTVMFSDARVLTL